MANSANTFACHIVSTGDCSRGNFSRGDCNKGDCSNGDCSTGDCSRGDCSRGYCSRKDCSRGDYSRGDCSRGDCSRGDCSRGDCSRGDCSRGDCSRVKLCTSSNESEGAPIFRSDTGILSRPSSLTQLCNPSLVKSFISIEQTFREATLSKIMEPIVSSKIVEPSFSFLFLLIHQPYAGHLHNYELNVMCILCVISIRGEIIEY
ncbi:Hypothetical predicted protein [Octopus vulgaris]|uniref:Uncharacterized protein n=1 Tax=Octopus vulgaris TaxID=6645 RepID=A0AA36AMY0_OCTVU|nr:Hypothetical predicted protein [Octopus vulgaris]